MSASWPKVIRDPVHGIIPFENTPADRLLLGLINTREMQRLRQIKQLGLSHLVFPGADHSRFAHSLGVMHMTRRFLDRIENVLRIEITEEQRAAVLAAALLHDVGHGPFSHAFERITKENHERRTLQIIRDPSTEVHQTLVSLGDGPDFPPLLAHFFAEGAEDESDEPEANAPIPPFLTHVVSSQLDADRFDYLLRDSYASGTDYGQFDADWLLQNLFVTVDHRRFYLGRKAVLQVEQYVFARYHMYRSVYFHKTTRAAEVMLQLLFRRFHLLVGQRASPAARAKIAPGASAAVLRAFSEAMSLDQYLELDDHTITEFLKACKESKDKTLKELAKGLLHRRLFKAVDVTGYLSPGVAKFTEAAKSIIKKEGFDPDYAFDSDTPGDTAYKLYDPEAKRPAQQIYVEGIDGRQKEISQESDTVRQLTKKYVLTRYYFPQEVRERVAKEAIPLLAME